MVFAAASLSEAVEQMASEFEAIHPDVTVSINVAGSSSLREQVLDGAPADVYLSADLANMDVLVDEGAVDGEPTVVATNDLTIGVPAGNPAGLEGVESFEEGSLLLGVCAPEVPCGDLAAQMFDAAGVDPIIDTEEPNVRALVLKISEGELDGGIVYATDVQARPDIDGLPIPATVNQTNSSPLAVLAEAPNPVAASLFADFVAGPEGERTFRAFGFGAP